MISRGTWQKLFVLTGVLGPSIWMHALISALPLLWAAEEHNRNRDGSKSLEVPFLTWMTHSHLEGQARFLPKLLSAGRSWSGTLKPVSRVHMWCLVLSCFSEVSNAVEASWQLSCLRDQRAQYLLGLLHLLVYLAKGALARSIASHLPS